MTERVQLENLEAITKGGVRRITWHVREGQTWVLATRAPGAVVERLDRGPGVVWRNQIVVTLPMGAELMRVEQSPSEAAPRDPIAYLCNPRATPRPTIKRSYFRVASRGELERVRSPYTPA